MSQPIQRVAIDSGGTFTDFVVLLASGERRRFKVPSTPDDPSRAIHEGLTSLSVKPADPVLHGTTVATNALLEAKGAKIGLITSTGFRDIHAIRRQNREDLFALEPTQFPSLVSDDCVYEIDIRPRAREVSPRLGEALLTSFLDSLPDEFAELDAVVISLIHGYAHPELEGQIADALTERFPGIVAHSASELVPFSREYERVETALANAFVGPTMHRYFQRLRKSGDDQWAIMESSGGLMTLDEAMEQPIRTAISGPAGGVAAAQRVLSSLNAKAALTLDMGGTSTDISFVTSSEIGQSDGTVGGRPLRIPMLPIDTIGAGGGSIARRDEAGVLVVGPESAGAYPGPAAYGRSEEYIPTLTDAHVCLGHIDSLLGGKFNLDREAAYKALDALVSDSDPTVEDVARSMIQIANANIVRAVRGLASRSPIALDDTILFAFGGAGGLHACEIAEELNVPKVYFPNEPGVFSAEGIADAPYILWESVSVHEGLTTYSAGADIIETLRTKALKKATTNYRGFSESSAELTLIADCHYRGQSHTLAVEIPGAHWASEGLEQWLTSAFIDRHNELYGYVLEDGTEVLLASFRMKLMHQPWRDSNVEGLTASSAITEGPAVLTSYGATLRLPAGWKATALSDGGYLCSKIEMKTERPAPPLEAYRLELVSVAEEMGATLEHAAFSANIKERRDYSCAIFSASGDLLAQAAHIPVHLGSQSESVRAVLRSGFVNPGESMVLNDPYAGGTHLPDITMVTPVFSGKELMFFVASRAHHADVGGPYPGSMPVPFTSTGEPVKLSIEDEGIRLAPTPVTEKSRNAIANASRTPRERLGDLKAQQAANLTGVRRLEALLELRRDDVNQYNTALLAFGRKQALALVESFPSGLYEAEELIEDDGHGVSPAIRLSLKRVDDCLVFNFSDTDPQTDSCLNAVKAVTTACVYYALKSMGGSRLPANEGVLKHVKIQTKAGTLCDARYPAAVSSGNVETSQRIVDVIFECLRLAFPAKMPAQSCGSMNNVILSGADNEGRVFVHYETHGGGMGAGPGGNGLSGTHSHMTNTLNTPIEELELEYPLEISEYRLAEAEIIATQNGTQGGRGLVRGYRFLCDGEATLIGERHRIAPRSTGADKPASPAKHFVQRLDGKLEPLGSKARVSLKAGEIVVLQTAGGGNWRRS
ncbi:MAG: hydantoinase B/oxoprolinase family protein [Myxococcota bacterium]|nr:hydantoinase B/oxoprolinase family protein [Myxococcota bacterium]